MTDADPRAHWDEIYCTKRSTSSGQPSKLLVQITEGLTPGRSLDLGSSNGDDVVWLATQGWQALGVDISGVACDRATARAASLELQGHARFEARDLGQGLPDGSFDLITALYFQSHVDLPRARVLREAAGRVAPGGYLLIVSHAAPPPWASAEMLAKADPFPTVEEELEVIADAPEDWVIRKAEKVSRFGKGPDGTSAELWDNLVWLQRCAA
ncbi:bifunctional 2-polyprenyl-6-hydroxyphenol methylase/3-demethylubiquinol 3-O-methyltransferase UbiG [Paracoccus sp. IB05]|uniref:class I SAM-dependent methyltransferase n=1 Tax=Paracoccus sp. IB05 TaxID=2779367 RepID=UPI0018E872FE|nr:class I SAM-dependent methyltransferase [Paracoccus sp. IB05]MBJ2149832.1 class I SAM-dependent methyltransferase [Paracoccus sp. IB05]